MTRLKLILSVVLTGGLAVVVVLQYLSLSRLRAENESLRLQLDEWSKARVAQPDSAAVANDASARDQLSELLKLRAEVTQLRSQSNQIASLRERNEKLLASEKEKEAIWAARPKPASEKSPEDALPQDIHPKESWAFRGYGTPDATVESVSWAMLNGDKAKFLAGFSPDMLAKLQPLLDGDGFSREMSKIDRGEFRILDRQTLSDDEMVLTVYATRKDASGNYVGKSEDTTFKRIDGLWKVADSANAPQ